MKVKTILFSSIPLEHKDVTYRRHLGEKVKDLAAKYHVHPSTVRRWIKRTNKVRALRAEAIGLKMCETLSRETGHEFKLEN